MERHEHRWELAPCCKDKLDRWICKLCNPPKLWMGKEPPISDGELIKQQQEMAKARHEERIRQEQGNLVDHIDWHKDK